MPSVTQNTSKLPVCTVHLKWTEPWNDSPAPHLLRGAVGEAFGDNDLFHQHTPEGRPIYRYPRVHYRWDTRTGDGVVFGIGEGVQALGDLFVADLELRLGTRQMRVGEADVDFRRHTVQLLPTLRRYRFRSPWLPLNQENYQRYETMTRDKRAAELDRIAVGNILGALKSLGVRVDGQLYAAAMPRRKLNCRYKDQSLCGFLGTLLTNIDLPDGFAVGKAVSHGYGWLAGAYGD